MNTIGCVSVTVAKEKVRNARTHVAEGKVAIDGMLWKDNQWVANERESAIEDLLFEDACGKYLNWYKANRQAYTHKQYALPAAAALKASFTGKRLSQISAFSIESHKILRKKGPDESHPDRRAVSDTTINHDLTFLRHMFNKCKEWKFAASNPMDSVELFKVDNGRTRHLTPAQAEALLSACDSDLRLLVLAAMMTGFRRKELLSLTWSAIDLVAATATVLSCYAKNGDARTVPLATDLKAALQRLRDERKPRPEESMFLYEGGPRKAWRRSFNTASKQASITDFRWHDLRLCFGSWLAQNGVRDQGRMELMGHRDHAMTRRYSHLTPGYKRKAIGSPPAFNKAALEGELQQISQQPPEANVVNFSR